MPIKHSKTSAKADGGDSTLVQPTDWNANHQLPTAGEIVTAGYGISLTNATAGTCAVSLTTANTELSADITATISAYIGVCTVSLAAGTWWLDGHAQITCATNTTIAHAASIRDSDGSVYAAASEFRGAVANNQTSLHMSALVSPATTKNYWIAVTSSRATSIVRRAAQAVTATPAPATYLRGFRIA